MSRSSRPARKRTEKGFTLVESVLAMAISSLTVGAVVVALFQFNHVTRTYGDSLTLGQQMQSAASVLNHDVVSASSATVDGPTLVLQIPRVAVFGDPISLVTDTVTYSFADDRLTRTLDSNSVTVARQLSGVDFGPAGAVSSTVQITVSASSRGQAVSEHLEFQRRPSD